MKQKMKIGALHEFSDIVGCLIKNGYVCKVKAVYDEYPRNHCIDYFEIIYWENERKEDIE